MTVKACRLIQVLFFLLCLLRTGLGQAGTIEVAMFEGGDGLVFFTNCARAYERERPGSTVNLYGDPRIGDKLRVRVLEGNVPEIMRADLNFWTLIRTGDVLPLDEYLDQPNWEGDSTWRESFLPGTLDRYSYKGKVYGAPLPYYAMGMWYNKGMFEAHGWKAPKTVEEFLALCRKVRVAGIPPIAFQGRYPSYAQLMSDAIYYQLAGRDRYYAQQSLEPGSFRNPELETAFRLVQEIATNYFQQGCMGMSHTEAQLEFFLGKTAMIPCGAWLKSETMGKIPDGFRLGYFNFPAVKNGVASAADTQVMANYFHVMAKARNPREAVEFLRFMTSRKMSARFCSERDIPVAVRGGNEGNPSPDMADLVAAINASSLSYGQAPGEGYPEMGQVWADVWAPLLTGKAAPADLCDKLEKAAAVIRARASEPDHVTVVPANLRRTKLFLGIVAAIAVFGLVSVFRKTLSLRRSGAGISAGRTRLGWKWILLFIGPAVLLYTLFVIVPSLMAFPWSLYQWDGLTAMKPVGLLNFKRLLLESSGFWTALQNNLFIMVVVPLFVIPLSLFLAACISRGLRGSTFFRIVFFFPNIVGGVAATLLWMHLYNPQGGPVHQIFSWIGAGLMWLGNHTPSTAFAVVAGDATCSLGGWLRSSWLMGGVGDSLVLLGQHMSSHDTLLSLGRWCREAWLTPDHMYWALVPMSVWSACGFNMILFLAAMESVPVEIYEAAEIDGAGAWRQFWTITVPMIWEVLSIAVVFMVIAGMKTFEIIWLLTNQMPTTDSHVVGTCMVQAMFTDYKVGQAAAIAVLLFAMVFFATVATMRVMKRDAVDV